MTRAVPVLLPVLLPALALLPACALERLAAIFEAHEDTYNTGDVVGTSEVAGGSTTEGVAQDTGTRGSTSTGEGEGELGSGGGTTGVGESSGGSTGGGAVCGDGQQDPGEECDDGDEDPMDGCKECMRDRFIFASSEEYQGGKIKGLYGADQRCRTQAALAKLPNFASYRAWLSDSRVAAGERLEHHRGRYTLVNGVVVAMDWDDLTDGELAHPINITEYAEVAEGVVWTGTLASGQAAFGSSFCFDWTDTASNWALEEGGAGIRGQTDALWSYFEQGGCGSTAALYCVEQRS